MLVKLNRFIDIFVKKASLLSDMAARSLVSLQDRNNSDIHSQRIALEGAKELLSLLYKALIVRYEQYSFKQLKMLGKFSIDNADQYIENFEMLKDFFSQPVRNNQPDSLWVKVISIAIEIAKFYKAAKLTKDTEDESPNIRRVLIYMNLFDGLAHNNGSIYEHLAGMEAFEKERGADKLPEDRRELFDYKNKSDLDKIIELRDVTNTRHLPTFIRNVEKNLDIKLPFKDQLQDIRQNPSFYESKTDLELAQDDEYYIGKLNLEDNKEFILEKAKEGFITAINKLELNQETWDIFYPLIKKRNNAAAALVAKELKYVPIDMKLEKEYPGILEAIVDNFIDCGIAVEVVVGFLNINIDIMKNKLIEFAKQGVLSAIEKLAFFASANDDARHAIYELAWGGNVYAVQCLNVKRDEYVIIRLLNNGNKEAFELVYKHYLTGPQKSSVINKNILNALIGLALNGNRMAANLMELFSKFELDDYHSKVLSAYSKLFSR